MLKRNPTHPGAIHLYIHAVEASTQPERALPYAKRLGALVPGAGHLVHMPAHIYYRVGLYRDSLDANRRAIQVDERYFKTSPSDPLYKAAYYPHNIHFVMVSAQMGGDGDDGGRCRREARRLGAGRAGEDVRRSCSRSRRRPTRRTRSSAIPTTILEAAAAAPMTWCWCEAMYHYARAIAYARARTRPRRSARSTPSRHRAHRRLQAVRAWGVPAKEIVHTAGLVASGRLADATGDLDAAAKAYNEAVAIEDALAYTEPPYWYYPVRQSLGSVRLRQGRLDDAEQAFRDSLARVRNNGWALAGLAEVERRKATPTPSAARAAFDRAWFGPRDGPDLAGSRVRNRSGQRTVRLATASACGRGDESSAAMPACPYDLATSCQQTSPSVAASGQSNPPR